MTGAVALSARCAREVRVPLVFLCALVIPLLFLGFLLGMARLERALLGVPNPAAESPPTLVDETLALPAPSRETPPLQPVPEGPQGIAVEGRARQIA